MLFIVSNSVQLFLSGGTCLSHRGGVGKPASSPGDTKRVITHRLGLPAPGWSRAGGRISRTVSRPSGSLEKKF